MAAERHLYSYEGPVTIFGTCVQNMWRGQTIATSVKKARSNLVFQWKRDNNKSTNSRVELPGEVKQL